jgi:hypothetical protein
LTTEDKDEALNVRYVLAGYKDNEGDDVRLQRFITVDRDELEEEKSSFTELISCVIKSVQLKSESDLESFSASQSESNDLLSRLQG